jgi:hypothetical protein
MQRIILVITDIFKFYEKEKTYRIFFLRNNKASVSIYLGKRTKRTQRREE